MKEILVYTSHTCPYCTLATNFLEEMGVSYTEKNIQSDNQARRELMDMGHMGVPVIIIDGEEIVGFDKERIKSLLA